jgi:hypothetical protein
MPRPIHYGQRVTTQKPTATSPEMKCAALREAVLDTIGRPDDLIRVDAITLWDEYHYRVNVYRNIKDICTLTDSFFIRIVNDGLISRPPLHLKYYDDVLAKISTDK